MLPITHGILRNLGYLRHRVNLPGGAIQKEHKVLLDLQKPKSLSLSSSSLFEDPHAMVIAPALVPILRDP